MAKEFEGKKEISAGRAKETKIKALEMTVEERTENVFPGTADRESLKSQQIFGRDWCTIENTLKQTYGDAIQQNNRTYNLMP